MYKNGSDLKPKKSGKNDPVVVCFTYKRYLRVIMFILCLLYVVKRVIMFNSQTNNIPARLGKEKVVIYMASKNGVNMFFPPDR